MLIRAKNFHVPKISQSPTFQKGKTNDNELLVLTGTITTAIRFRMLYVFMIITVHNSFKIQCIVHAILSDILLRPVICKWMKQFS